MIKKVSLILYFFTCVIMLQNLAYAKIAKEGVFIVDKDKTLLRKIYKNNDLIVDSVSELGFELYGPDGMTEWLTKMNIRFSALEEIDHRATSEYLNFKELENLLKKFEKSNPDIIKLISIGKSVQGRDLWFVKISDNVTKDEIEPEIKYIANMHGNEVTGRELVVKLIKDIIERYRENDKEITSLVNNTEIYIMPTLNPDGFELRRRSNANWYDLNRDFPDFITDPVNTSVNRAPETAALMKFQAKRKFSLSANYHDGASVINYPWDSTEKDPPLLGLIKNLSSDYASKIPEMVESTYFPGGIVNGNYWYEIHGGMQDWSYFWHDDLQITIEVSKSKWPSYYKIAELWDNHRIPMINFLSSVHQGIGIYTKDGSNSIITIEKIKNDKTIQKIGTYKFNNEFYKVLGIGEYRLTIINSGKKLQFTKYVTGEVENNFISI